MPYSPRIARRRTAAATLEPLECRRLLAGNGPEAVTGVRILGTPEAVTGVVLTFRVALDPVSAQDTGGFELVRKFKEKGGFFSEGGSKSKTIGLETAVYDDAARTVTLTPKNEFELGKSFRRIRVQGSGGNGVRTADGSYIDGNRNNKPGGDAVITFKAYRAARFTYKDADKDRVTLRLTGAGSDGKILAFVPKTKNPVPLVFVRGAEAATSVLTATIKKAKRGDGMTTIQQLQGTSTATVDFLANPAFRIELIEP